MAETIKSFLVSLGYSVDSSSENRFKRSVEGATKAVNAMALSLAAATVAVSAAITKIAANFDDLYWTSQRTKASAENIKALGYAVSQLGGSYQGAVSSIEEFARRMRSNPGYEAMARNLGVVTRENGKLRDTTAIMTDLAKVLSRKPQYVALQYLEALGIDENTYNALKSGDLVRYTEEYRKKQQALGVDQQRAAEIGKDLTNAWRALGATAQTVGEKLMQELGPGLKDFVERVDAFLMRNSDRIVEFFKKAADLVGKLMDAFVQLVEKGEGPIVEMFDKIVKALDGAKKAFEIFATFLAGAFLISVLSSFGKVGAGFAAMLLKLGINPATLALGLGAYGVKVIGDANAERFAGVEPGEEHNQGRQAQRRANDAARQRIDETRRQNGEGRSGEQGTGWWGWVKRKLGFGGSDASTANAGAIPGLSEKAAADYANRLGRQESGNNYAQPGNQYGFRGRWQMGGPALADAGYVRKGTRNSGLTDASNWLGKDGLNSLDDFLANKDGGQDKAFAAYTAINYARLKKLGVIRDGMSEEEIAGWLAVAHLLGPKGASDLSRGVDAADGNGTRGSSYFNMMKGLRTGDSARRLSPEGGSPFIGALNSSALSNVQANSALVSGGTALVPSAANNNTTITMSPRTEVTILGGSDPQATGAAVADAQNGVNGRLLRNLQGATR